jgi:hydrogenase expression/formation protein HypC
MCLALPARVIALHDDQTATVSLGGLKKSVSLALVDEVAIGDYVIVHTGFALSRLDPEEAERTLALRRDAGVPTGAPGSTTTSSATARSRARSPRRSRARRAPIAATGSWSSAAVTPTRCGATASCRCCRHRWR